jgi:hypothetical protein
MSTHLRNAEEYAHKTLVRKKNVLSNKIVSAFLKKGKSSVIAKLAKFEFGVNH